MKTILQLIGVAAFFTNSAGGWAATHYVDLHSPSPTAPFANWTTAAHIIQDAVDASAPGDDVLVTNGIYAVGGRPETSSLLTNRVVVDKALWVHSANGPDATVIQGYQMPGITNGDAAVRCVYLDNGASLAGFTLTGGGTWDDSGGGSQVDAEGGGLLCGSYAGVVSNCVVTSNSAFDMGGGSCGGTLNHCTLSNNSARSGGGASWLGGWAATLSNCTLTANSAEYGGGGSYGCLLYNCELVGNSASLFGGGAFVGVLNNCTLTGNSASSGAGARGRPSNVVPGNVILNNCIVYFNTADSPLEANYGPFTYLNYCCTTPLPLGGTNTTADPLLSDCAHLSAASPCRGTGGGDYISGTDIDSEPWDSPPSIGCDEYHPGATGPLQVVLNADYARFATDFTVNFSSSILGHASSNRWDFGDGVSVTSQVFRPSVSHAWTNPGSYVVALTAYNETYPNGLSASVAVQVVTRPVYCVSSANPTPVPPYSSWATAANNIQDAVDVASLPGALVLVTNGVYVTGGRPAGAILETNRVAVDKPLTLRSVSGPQFTLIIGQQDVLPSAAVRCVYLDKGATLCGFTLTNGYAFSDGNFGGGVWCASTSALVTNCVLAGNWAGYGGGAHGGTLANCALVGNQASIGGGAASATLQSCTLVSNIAAWGAGAYSSSLTDCTLAGNLGDPGAQPSRGGGASQSILDHCTLIGNFANFGGGADGGNGYNPEYPAYAVALNNCRLTGNSAEAGAGGGAYSCSLNNCALSRNSATNGGYGGGTGGGAVGGTLDNCTLMGNSAQVGGGAAGDQDAGICTLNNCIVYLNTAQSGANYDTNCVLSYCCTTPLPSTGFDNITNDPLFVDLAGGNLRLQSNSPCINAGNRAYAPSGPDLDGNPRIAGGTVDIGAYEFQNPTSLISYAWLQEYGLPTDGSADFADPDGDGMNNWQEWRCGTNPTNSLSALRIISVLPTGTSVTVSWHSVAGINYFLERSTNLIGSAPVFTPVAAGIPGQDGTTSYTDRNAVGPGPRFYRLGIGN